VPGHRDVAPPVTVVGLVHPSIVARSWVKPGVSAVDDAGDARMNHRLRLVLSVVNGLLLLGASLVAVWRTTEPAVRVIDSPVLAAGKGEQAAAAAPAPAVQRHRAPVSPPADAYAAEPIQEIGAIEIPKIGLVHRVFHGISMRNIDRGPSHWPGTALPGEVGNTVFAGHRVTHSHPFRHIDRLVPGDEVFFTIAGVRSRYLVTGHEIVPPTALRIVEQTPTPTGTLFACHPPGSARQRYVVRLALAEP
jgi:LPXTG-site transpeptidase (sortase) family protein